MTNEKKNISATQWGAIIVALIGLCGTIGAAVVAGCLGSPGICFPASPTLTPPAIDTPTPIINSFEGTWINVYNTPPTFGLQYALSQLEISKIDLNTAKVSACRCDSSACKSKIQLDPLTALATLQENSLSVDDADKFNLAEHLTWKVTVKKDNKLLLVTLEEELPDGTKKSANFDMKLLTTPFGHIVKSDCGLPVFTIPP